MYIVQPGDNLSYIANWFRVSLADLMEANNLTADSVIYPGMQLIIPGLEGVNGILTTIYPHTSGPIR